MINADKKQEGIANIIKARNKYSMLRTRKERMAAYPGVREKN